MHILKQLAGAGLLDERVYQMPEDSEGDHTTVDQAKIDPAVPQNVSTDNPNPQENDGEKEEDEEPKEDEPKEEDEPAPAATVQIDGSRALAALHAALHSTQVLADLVYGAKDELVTKLGDEAAPALHEVLFKVKTAHETLAKLMDGVDADPAEDTDATEEPTEEPDPNATEAETEVPGAAPETTDTESY